MSEQPEGDQPVTTDNGDGTQTVHATAVLQAAAATGNEEENG